jgi:flagellar operon protein
MADTTVNGIKVPFLPVGGVDGLKERHRVESPGGERSFDQVLQKEIKEVKFSKHAQERLDTRNIKLGQEDMNHIEQAVTKAEEKGSKESLVLLRDMAFIVSVANRTVVTAIAGDQLRDNVFTNIDSAVIAT